MKKYLSGFIVFSMVLSMFSFSPNETYAASIFSDSFGANNLGTDSDPISWNSWSAGGNNGNEDDAEIRVSSNGNDAPSPDGGRHAVILGEDGFICKTIDTTGYTNVKLSYYWIGDTDAENADQGLVEYKANGESCTANSFTQLQNHDLSVDNTWSTQAAFDLPNSLDNTTFKLRFRVNASSSDEHFRVDGIAITGDAIAPYVPPSSTVVVRANTSAGENLPGWMFNRDSGTQTPFTFNTTAPDIGSGSLYVKPIMNNINGGNDKFIGENFINTLISDITSISYDFKIGAGGVDTQEEQFYMNVYANFGVSDDLKYYDCRYNVVPTIGSTGGFTTMTFDPNMAYDVTTRGSSPFTCPAIPADMNDLSAGSNIRAFALSLGDTSISDQGLDGYFDKVVVSTTSAITTYDFEPSFGNIQITKYACPEGVTTLRSTNGVGMPQPSGCIPEAGKTFGYVYGTQTDANAPHPELSAPVTPGGTTNASGILTIPNLPTNGRYLIVETDPENPTTKLPHGEVLGLYCTGDGDMSDSNDNQEITFVTGHGNTTHCVAYNTDPAPDAFHVSPADGAVEDGISLVQVWGSTATDIAYFLYESWHDQTFTNLRWSQTIAGTSKTAPNVPEAEFWWRVRSVDLIGNMSPWTPLWKIIIDHTPDEEVMCVEDATMTVVSDTSVTPNTGSTITVTPHPAYTSISGATWIWNQPEALDGDNVMSAPLGTSVFTKTFNVVGTPMDGTLQIAADNTYTVVLNGATLDTGTSGTDADNFTTADTWNIPSEFFVTGENTLVFTVDNGPKPEGYTGVNPAGLLFKLVLGVNECEVPPTPTVKVNILKYLKGEGLALPVSNGAEILPFPMTATWNTTNIGAGTGDYILGDNHGGSTMKYGALTSAMNAPVASYTTFERTNTEDEGVNSVIPVGGECVENRYRLVGYKYGNTLEEAEAMEGVVTSAPVFENFSTDKYLLVINEDCDYVISQQVQNGTLLVKKTVINNETGTMTAGDFSFTVNGMEGMYYFSENEGNELEGEYSLSLPVGTYTVTENDAPNYAGASVNCTDIVISEDQTTTCTFTNDDFVHSGGGSGGAPTVAGASTETPNTGTPTDTGSQTPTPTGQVLGESTCSAIYLNDFLAFGKKNNPEQVKLLQTFLNEELALSPALAVDGVFNKTTKTAVIAFQEKYASEILTPWAPFGLKSGKGTGYVYKTTKWKINMIKCAELKLEVPQLP